MTLRSPFRVRSSARMHLLALTLTAVAPCTTASAASQGQPASSTYAQPLPVEAIPAVAPLPDVWPKGWVLIQDFNFNAILDGRVAVVDTASTNPLKGLIRAAQFANVLVNPAKNEIYTSETFYPRLTRGTRTDAITIWDMKTLAPKDEIVLPGGKRELAVTYPHLFQFTNDRNWALVANFTPAQSITVVDLQNRKVLNEIDLPGCSQIYPTGTRGFSSLCADGAVISVTLDAAGKVASSQTVKNVQDVDNQPLFSTPAMAGRTAWFVSQRGLVQGLDLSGEVARPLPSFTLPATDGGAPEWRPSGWQVITADAVGRLYVLMNPHGKEGSHKDGGSEIWVIDPASHQRLARFPLHGTSIAISITSEDQPHLVAIRADGVIDVYDPAGGAFVRSLGATVAFNPILITPVR